MAKKIKEEKLSINYFEKFYEEISNVVTLKITENFEVSVKRFISFQAAARLVNEVVSSCIMDGIYTPLAEEFAFKKYIIEEFSNITLPMNAEKQYEFIYGTDIFNAISQEINPSQLREIKFAIQRTISMLIDDSKNDAKEELREIAKAYTEIMDKYAKLIEIVEETFGDVNISDAINTLGKINKFDEDKLIDAILDRIEFPDKSDEPIIEVVK